MLRLAGVGDLSFNYRKKVGDSQLIMSIIPYHIVNKKTRKINGRRTTFNYSNLSNIFHCEIAEGILRRALRQELDAGMMEDKVMLSIKIIF